LESRPTVSATELVDRINGGRSGYRSAMIGGALIIRPPDHRAAYLDAPTPLGAVRAVGLLPVLRTLFQPLESRLTNGGVVASIIHGPDETGQLTFDLDLKGRTTVEALALVATQARAHPWIVRTSGDESVRVSWVGYFLANGSTVETEVQAPTEHARK